MNLTLESLAENTGLATITRYPLILESSPEDKKLLDECVRMIVFNHDDKRSFTSYGGRKTDKKKDLIRKIKNGIIDVHTQKRDFRNTFDLSIKCNDGTVLEKRGVFITEDTPRRKLDSDSGVLRLSHMAVGDNNPYFLNIFGTRHSGFKPESKQKAA